MNIASTNRAELKEKVLAAIRAQPRCEGVAEVSISVTNVEDEGTSWRATVVDNGTAPLGAAYSAAGRVTEELGQKYRVID